MILTRAEIEKREIVKDGVERGWRATTYDATVGSIITKKGVHDSATYTLPPRGIVWVVSRETFTIPGDVTGLATLRTSWTHKGVLTLTLGVVDAGWSGPVSTAVVNFGRSEFMITAGDPFFRILFHTHEDVSPSTRSQSHEDYRRSVIAQTRDYSDTFLTVDTLAPEIARSIFGMPRWGVYIGLGGLILAALATIVPVASTLLEGRGERLRDLESRVLVLETERDVQDGK